MRKWIAVTFDGESWRVDIHIDNYVACGSYPYKSRVAAKHAAKRLSVTTGWPVVEN